MLKIYSSTGKTYFNQTYTFKLSSLKHVQSERTEKTTCDMPRSKFRHTVS